MRQIKFRGKDAVTKQWVYGDLLHICGGCLIYHGSQTGYGECEYKGVQLAMDEISVVIPDTIGQFTGLHDKDGKEIYEGDIADLVSITPRYWRVVYSGGTFSLYGINSTLPCWKPFFNDEYGVCYVYSFIGNIYDNTDLAKED